jgi:lipopolysaccharide exporter
MKNLLARGAIWIAATRIAINLIGFCSTLLLARMLLPEDFGLVAIANTVILILASVTEISLTSALVQHKDPTDDHYDTAFTLGAIRAFILAAIAALLSWPIAEAYGDHRLVALILAFAAASALGGFNNPKLAQFTRALIFHQEFILGISAKLLGFIGAAIIAIIWHSYWALLVGSLVSQISNLIVSYVLVRYRPRLSLGKAREILSFSVWLTLSQIVITLNYRFDTLFLGMFVGKTSLGHYSFGDNLANMVTREATSPVANTLFPAFARLTDDIDRMRSAYFKSQGALFAISFPIGVGFAMIAEPLILLTVGEKWREAVFVIQVIAATTGWSAISATYLPLAMALGQTRAVFNRDVMSFASRIPILVFGLWAGGLVGFVYARVIAATIGVILNMVLIRSLINIDLRRQFIANMRPIFAAAMMVLVLLAARQQMAVVQTTTIMQMLGLAIQVALGGMTYALATWGFWVALGRPDGVESEVAAVISRMTGKGDAATRT